MMTHAPPAGGAAPARPVVLIHIPKTAGTSLRLILEHVYGSGRMLVWTGPMSEGRAALRSAPPERLAGFDVISGHLPFGVQDCLGRPAAVITFLRDPVERLLSLYSFIRSDPAHPRHAEFVRKGYTFGDFVRRLGFRQTDNGQVRALAGGEACDLPRGALREEHLDRARRNLEKGCAEFGLAERFPESIERLGSVLGWPPVPVIVANVTRERIRREDVPRADLDAAEHHNRLDRQLYDFARALFEARGSETGVA